VTTASRWIELDGADNVRDLGGLRTADGRTVQPHRLIRADSLQALTPTDVRRLVDEMQVRAVADLRTGVELESEGPGPMSEEPAVEIKHFSLFPEADAPENAEGPVVLPWQTRDRGADPARRRGTPGIYLQYLEGRADSVLAALRLIAHTDGATVVHCAAGKDRTGVVIALALAEVGVRPADIVADYVLSADRIEAIMTRLAGRPTYAADIAAHPDFDKHKPRPATMEQLLGAIDELHGGVPAWLRAHGWTEQDAAALRARLLD
jgi:rhodanese-related sulfurtransferase